MIQYEANKTTKPIIAEVIILPPSATLSWLPPLAIIVNPPTTIITKIIRPATI